MRVLTAAEPPSVENGAIWLNTNDGKRHYRINLSESPRNNKATNPSFESTSNMQTIAAPQQFIAASQNMRYGALDSGVNGQNWSDRKVALAQIMSDSGVSIVGCQENGVSGTSTSQPPSSQT